jgi:membrane-associated phospholipid phosphatase
MLVGLVLSLAVTAWWQISLHNSVAGGTVTVLALAFGPVVLAVSVVGAAAIGWSRLVLRAHTVAQVVAGTALGAASGLVFALLR